MRASAPSGRDAGSQCDEGDRGCPLPLTAVAIGVALGIFSVLADGIVRWRAFTTLGNIISPWVIAAFAAGRLARGARTGAWAGTGALVVGVVTYYVVQVVRFSADEASSAYLMGAAPLVWLTAAFVMGPLMGAAGAASTRPRPSVRAAIALPVILLAEAGHLVLDRRPWRWNLAQEIYRLNDAGVFVVLGAVALAVPALFVPERRRRRKAYAALFPCAVAAAFGIWQLNRLLVAI
jgi:hypothetical protein